MKLTKTALVFFVCCVSVIQCFAWDDVETDIPRIVINPNGHTGKIFSLNYTPDGEKIITASEDKSIRVWDAETGKLINSFFVQSGDGPEGMLYTSSISPDGRFLALAGYPVSGASQNYILLVDLQKEKQVGIAYGHQNVINIVDFSYDGKYLASGSDDGSVMIWKVSEKGNFIRKGELYFENRITSLSFSNNNMTLAVTSTTNDIKLFNLTSIETTRTGFPNIELQKHSKPVKHVIFSPDGKYLASCDEQKKVMLWTSQGEFIKELSGFDHDVNVLSFSYDDKLLVAMNNINGAGSSFSIPQGNKLTDYSGHNNSVLAADFSPKSVQGNYQVASAGGLNNEIMVWNAINGNTLKTIKGEGRTITTLQFNGSNELMFAKSGIRKDGANSYSFNLGTFQLNEITETVEVKRDQKIQQVDLYTIRTPNGQRIENDPAVDGRILNSVALPDGNVVIGSDFSLKLYGKQGHLIKEFVGHTGAVRALATDAEGTLLASGGEDQTIKIWRTDAQGVLPSLWEVYDDEEYHEFFTAYGLDSVAKLNTRDAWLTTIAFLEDNKEKVYKSFEETLQQLGEYVKPVTTLFVAEDKEWICYTPSGYFACSSQGGKYFIWQVNKGLKHLADYYNADQYFDILYRPDLVKESISTGNKAEEILLAQGQKVFDLTKLDRPSAGLFDRPTSVNGQSRGIDFDRRSYTTKKERIRLSVDLYDGGGGIKEVNIYQNNKLIIVDDEVGMFNDDKITKHYDVDLVNGVNDFKVVVINYQKIESRPDHVVVNYVGDLIATSDLYVLSIGINQYKKSNYNLNYAQPDARAFTSKIRERSNKMFKNVYVHEIYDDEALKSSIISAFKEISQKANPQDVFVFYYAGHGSLDTENPDSEYFLIPHDVTQIYGDLEQLEEKAIASSELKTMLSGIKCQKQLILLDACHSGGAVKSFLTRAAAPEEKAIFQLARSAGVVLIAASGTQQYATEFDILNHGVFTYALLECLDGKVASIAADKRITVNELKAYMEDRVPELSLEYGGKAQFPTGFSNGQDFPISLLVE